MCNVTLPLVVGNAALLWRLGQLRVRSARRAVVAHALVVVVFGLLVASNLESVYQLRSGRPAPADPRLTCCHKLLPAVRPVAQAIYDHVGNPFQFPASLIFALRHDVPLKKWDAMGQYPLVPGLDALVTDRFWSTTATWPVGEGGLHEYLDGFSPPQLVDRRRSRWTLRPDARVLVPLLLQDGHRLGLWLAPGTCPRVTLTWNHRVVVETALPEGWSQVSVDVPARSVGVGELGIRCPPWPADARPAPGLAVPGGVAVGPISLSLRRP
jgi:hypothetical protein